MTQEVCCDHPRPCTVKLARQWSLRTYQVGGRWKNIVKIAQEPSGRKKNRMCVSEAHPQQSAVVCSELNKQRHRLDNWHLRNLTLNATIPEESRKHAYEKTNEMERMEDIPDSGR